MAVGCLAGEKVDRQGWVWPGFSVIFSLAISVSVTDFSVSFDFSIGVLGKSLALARRAFLFSLRRRCTKSLPSEVSLSMFTSSSSVPFLILFGVFVRFMVVFVQLPATELSSFIGRTLESLPKSPSDHMVPTLVVALPLLLLSYTYFNYNFTVFFCPYQSLLTPYFHVLKFGTAGQKCSIPRLLYP